MSALAGQAGGDVSEGLPTQSGGHTRCRACGATAQAANVLTSDVVGAVFAAVAEALSELQGSLVEAVRAEMSKQTVEAGGGVPSEFSSPGSSRLFNFKSPALEGWHTATQRRAAQSIRSPGSSTSDTGSLAADLPAVRARVAAMMDSREMGSRDVMSCKDMMSSKEMMNSKDMMEDRSVVSVSGRLFGGSPAMSERRMVQEGSETSISSLGRRRLCPAGPLTVQSMQANVAQALLEDVGFSFSRQTTPAFARQTSGAKPPRDPMLKSSPGQRSMARVVPAPEVVVPPRVMGVPGGMPGIACPRIVDSLSVGSGAEAPLGMQHDRSKGFEGPGQGGRRSVTSSQVLRARVTELARQASMTIGIRQRLSPGEVSRSVSRGASRSVPIALLFSGVLPWGGPAGSRLPQLYQWLVRVLVGLSVAALSVPGMGPVQSDCDAYGPMCWRRDGFSQLTLLVGAVLVLLPFVFNHRQLQLEEAFELLASVSLQRRFRGSLTTQVRMDTLVFVFTWLGIVFANLLGGYSTHGQHYTPRVVFHIALHTTAHAILAGVILSLTYAMVFVCRSLSTLIDVFCCDVVGQTDLQDVSHVWNLTQAVLRKVSDSVETCFLTLCIVVMLVAPLLVVDVVLLGIQRSQMLLALPGWLVACAVAYMLFLAAGISEKCTRVPALVNAISCEETVGIERQKTVDYITSSAAGFYILDTRLTTGVVVKLTYTCCVLVVGLLTRAISVGGGFDA